MSDSKHLGRVVGAMLLLQLVGLMVGFILITEPLRATDFLSTAAADAGRVKAGVVVLLANCGLAIATSVTAWRVFREYSSQMGIWLMILSLLMFVMQAVDTVHIMSMLSLSERFVESGGAQSDVYNALAASVRATRRFAHYLELLSIDFWFGMFYAIVLRFTLVPRLVAGFSILTLVLHFVAVPAPGFLGYGINTSLGVPLAFGMLAMSVWLIWKGFRDASPLELGTS